MNKFIYEGGYRTWTPSINGNPQQEQAIGKNAILQYWQYNRTQFEHFLLDSQSKRMNQLRKYDLKQKDGIRVPDADDDEIMNDNENEVGGTTTSSGGVEFLAMEWNFFQHEHFFNQPHNNYLQQEANLEVITIIRDPYERFISNFIYTPDNKGRVGPLEWAQKDYKRLKGRFGGFEVPPKKQTPRHDGRRPGRPTPIVLPSHNNITQYGKVITNVNFRVNYNKPNYYTAYLNGLAQNDDDDDTEYGYKYSFGYFAFELNRTHLEIAKERLRDMFDVILVLERPETHQQLSKWFAFTEDSNSTTITTTTTTNNDPSYVLPIANSAKDRHESERRKQKAKVLCTKEEFYKYNALDKELYDFAIELSLSKQQQQQQKQRQHL